MKNLISFLIPSLMALFFFIGCGGQPATKLDATVLTASFADASAPLKPHIDQAAAALEQSQLTEALKNILEGVKSVDGKLPVAQSTAIENTITMVQRVMSENPDKLETETTKLINQIMDAMIVE